MSWKKETEEKRESEMTDLGRWTANSLLICRTLRTITMVCGPVNDWEPRWMNNSSPLAKEVSKEGKGGSPATLALGRSGQEDFLYSKSSVGYRDSTIFS